MQTKNLSGRENYILVLLATIATLWGYDFGQSDHLEHLPILYRLLDADYLLNDDFVNVNTSTYNPRLLLFYVLVPLAKLVGVPALYLVLAWACNFFTARATALIAKIIWQDVPTAPLWAAVAVLAVPLSGWGEVAYLRTDIFIPSAAATAFVLHGLYYLLLQRWLLMALVLGAGAVAHPLVVPVSGAMLWLVGGADLCRWQKLRFRAYYYYLGGGLLWAAIVAAIILPYLLQNWWAAKIDGAVFVDIYARFRNPHHFMPSFFMNAEETTKAWQWAGVLVLLLNFHFLAARSYQKNQLWLILALVLIVFALLPFGAWGVEVKKSRFWAMLQVFRFLFIAKWFVLFLLGGFLARIFSSNLQPSRLKIKIYFLAYIVLVLQPYYLFWAVGLHILGQLLQQAKALLLIKLVVGGLAFWAFFQIEDKQILYLPTALIAFAVVGSNKLYTALSTAFVLALLSHWLVVAADGSQSFLKKHISHGFNLSNYKSPLTGVAKYLRENTDPQALIYAPPSSSELRLTARRALVVDFKTLPFDDLALVAWQARLFDCFGYTEKLGFEAQRWVFIPNYEYSPMEQQIKKAKFYKADYLLLYTKSEHGDYPLLYQDGDYKLVKVVVSSK
jgi:hypothetical protein